LRGTPQRNSYTSLCFELTRCVCISPVAEVEVTEVAVLLNSVVQPLVQDLDEGTHIRKVLVHLGAVGKVAGKSTKLIVKMIWLIGN